MNENQDAIPESPAFDSSVGSDVPVDAEGNPIPAELAPVFANRTTFTRLGRAIDGLIRDVEALAMTSAGYYLHASLRMVLADLRNGKRGIEFCKPHGICPYCRQRPQVACPACRNQRWVHKELYQVALQQLKRKS